MARQTCTKTTEELRRLVADLLQMAEEVEYHAGGRSEAEARKRAETLARARKVARKQGEQQ